MSALAVVSDRLDVALNTALQPIVSLVDERVLGFEALTRVRGVVDVAVLFERASGGRAVELNLGAIGSALEATGRLPDGALLFVNADPVVLASPQLPPLVRDSASRTGFPLSSLVVEITERSPFIDLATTTAVIDDLRSAGVRFALDDFGSAHSHLAHVDVVTPSFIKIGHGFGTAFERNATHTRIVRSIAGLARELACSTILEGVETPATALAGRAMGIEFAQGYHFGAPGLPSPSSV